PPQSNELDLRSPIVEFRPGYVRRALRSFTGHEFGIGVIHSHPEGTWPSPSRLDDDMDDYFSQEFERYSEGRPYVSLIIARDDHGQRTFSGRAFDRGEWLPVKTWITAGLDVVARDKAFDWGAPAPVFDPDATKERLMELIGCDAMTRLREATVGIIGCSGLGSPAAHVLARAGIGRFVLVDKGRFKPSNHERNHASRASDTVGDPPWKTDLLCRLVHEIAPNTRVTCIVGDVLDEAVVDELVQCDLVLGCTDSVYARAALGDLALHYHIPVLDLAVQMRASDSIIKDQVGEIARYAAGLPCPWCRGRVNARDIFEETISPEEKAQRQHAAAAARARGADAEQYWTNGERHELTVGYMTTTVAAMGAGYTQHWLTGLACIPHDRFQFDLGLQQFGFVKDQRSPCPDCLCQQRIGFADQGRADRTVSKPHHWPEAKLTHCFGKFG
ncbi:MAG: hypothetical protein RIQ79_2531, partial [Verrucomicrobiota bacterium]